MFPETIQFLVSTEFAYPARMPALNDFAAPSLKLTLMSALMIPKSKTAPFLICAKRAKYILSSLLYSPETVKLKMDLSLPLSSPVKGADDVPIGVQFS
ncbi:MAG: hypothetical protein IJZ07_01410 [Clostridia bacterium]|nr:hypothetical protein [Clostridia bacterium]